MLFAIRCSSLSLLSRQARARILPGAGGTLGDWSLIKSKLTAPTSPQLSLSLERRTLVTGSLAHRRHQRRIAALETPYSKHAKLVPSRVVASGMPLRPSEMDNDSLVVLAALENDEARCEVLKRHIMATDRVTYADANETFERIKESNRRGMSLEALPYQIGIFAAVSGAFLSFPMCFHLPTVHTFNEIFVTADVPEPKDLETALEVGAWAWNWVEPVLGQLSFFLLCMQYSRAQLQNMGIKPFTSQLKRSRASRVSKEFPQYDRKILADFSETDSLWRV